MNKHASKHKYNGTKTKNTEGMQSCADSTVGNTKHFRGYFLNVAFTVSQFGVLTQTKRILQLSEGLLILADHKRVQGTTNSAPKM